ncbi:hypothetical protein GRI99_17675 [Altererythrobacter buctensis]|uniref:Recombinase zinc beta ribbon domain-containing protein n=1 Tax=Alteraurantiacibacter buctensis TaxID=1503981 RepID=A0A844Z2L2_9SPHN|nr:hypothetical protein [Alteraurantiacibacter buctensis]
MVHDVPELRIVDEALWDQVASKLEQLGGGRPDQARRPKRLLSGLLKCGHCGGNYTVIAKDYWGCSNRRQTGTCQNHALIRDGEAQERIWTAVRNELLHPDVIAAYVEEVRKAAAEWRRSQISRRADEDRRLNAIKDEQAKLVEAIVAGVDPSLLKQRSLDLRAECDAIEAARIDIDQLEHLLSHPALSESYRRRCEDLSALAATGANDIARARPLISSLVDRIDVTPHGDGTKGADLIVHGQLAALLSIPQNANGPATDEGGEASSLKLVAGVGFEPTTFRL